MPQQALTAVENNFTGGLKTEFTALNFPENACTEVDNCYFSTIGEVSRRLGVDKELTAAAPTTVVYGNRAKKTFIWKNAGGMSNVDLVVVQIGSNLFFYRSSDVTNSNPLSNTILVSSINLAAFITGNDPSVTECTFASGNGYLFVFHRDVQTLACKYEAGAVTASPITIEIRDFLGPVENIAVGFRPSTLSVEHQYNLMNRGWTSGAAWTTTSATSHALTVGPGKVFTVGAGLIITPGDDFKVTLQIDEAIWMTGTVTSYAGTTLTLDVDASSGQVGAFSGWNIVEVGAGYIDTWFADIVNYPSQSDVWWKYKDPTTNIFDPAATIDTVTANSGAALQGHYILDAVSQQRTGASGIIGLTAISTFFRPSVGAWFQGRVWYSGLNDAQAATGNAPFYSWSENIYFSQVITSSNQFGRCYQNNDPTSEDFFDLLPTDGGVITIQGAGSIYELFPIQNGLIVRSANGIYFITGSQGIGFAANDYTITKISDKTSISSHSVNLEGFPIFWNEEGIHYIHPTDKGGGLTVDNLCQGSIQSFYASIPTVSKKYARGAYDPVNFEIKWVYRETPEVGISDRYNFNKILNFNTQNKSFYPYTVDSPIATISEVFYLTVPGDVNSPDPTFKYMVLWNGQFLIFGQEIDNTNWKDFFQFDGAGTDYTSYFVTGYKLHGQGVTKWQPVYVQMFSVADEATSYKIQGIWDYANSPNSGRYSTIQLVTNALSRFGIKYRRHKIRGTGLALQLKVASVSGLPFKIIGWSSQETKNASI